MCKRVPDRYTRRARNSFKRGGTPPCRPDFDRTSKWDTLDEHVHMSWDSANVTGGYTIRCSSTEPATIWTKGQIKSFTFKFPVNLTDADDARSVFVGAMCMTSLNDGDGEYDREILGSFRPLWGERNTSQESIAYNKTWSFKDDNVNGRSSKRSGYGIEFLPKQQMYRTIWKDDNKHSEYEKLCEDLCKHLCAWLIKKLEVPKEKNAIFVAFNIADSDTDEEKKLRWQAKFKMDDSTYNDLLSELKTYEKNMNWKQFLTFFWTNSKDIMSSEIKSSNTRRHVNMNWSDYGILGGKMTLNVCDKETFEQLKDPYLAWKEQRSPSEYEKSFEYQISDQVICIQSPYRRYTDSGWDDLNLNVSLTRHSYPELALNIYFKGKSITPPDCKVAVSTGVHILCHFRDHPKNSTVLTVPKKKPPRYEEDGIKWSSHTHHHHCMQFNWPGFDRTYLLEKKDTNYQAKRGVFRWDDATKQIFFYNIPNKRGEQTEEWKGYNTFTVTGANHTLRQRVDRIAVQDMTRLLVLEFAPAESYEALSEGIYDQEMAAQPPSVRNNPWQRRQFSGKLVKLYSNDDKDKKVRLFFDEGVGADTSIFDTFIKLINARNARNTDDPITIVDKKPLMSIASSTASSIASSFSDLVASLKPKTTWPSRSSSSADRSPNL